MAKSPYEVEIHVNSSPRLVFSKLFKDVNSARMCFDAVHTTLANADEVGSIYEVRLWNHSTGREIMRYEFGRPLYDGMQP